MNKTTHNHAVNTESIDIFVEVVDAQSFSRAANRLGMPATTVSAKIARLEERLGVTLIQRTTRQLRVTPAGRRYYERCVRALAEIAEGERELADVVEEPRGLLRITAPADLAQALLTPVVERFLDAYPKVSVDLKITNRVVDLISEEVDLALRVGPLKDSTLVVRKFKSGRLNLWAAKSYLQRFGLPRTRSDLSKHTLLRLSRLQPGFTLKSPAGETINLESPSRIATDDFSNLKALIQRGRGIGVLPDFMGEESGSAGSLVKVLSNYRSDIVSIYFAYPTQRFVPKTVQAFIAVATGDPRQT